MQHGMAKLSKDMTFCCCRHFHLRDIEAVSGDALAEQHGKAEQGHQYMQSMLL